MEGWTRGLGCEVDDDDVEDEDGVDDERATDRGAVAVALQRHTVWMVSGDDEDSSTVALQQHVVVVVVGLEVDGTS